MPPSPYMPAPPPVPETRPPRGIFLVVLLLVLAVAVVQLGRWALDDSVLTGATEQRIDLALEIDGAGVLRSLQTEVVGRCAFGNTWKGTWEPVAADLPEGFRQQGTRVEAHERSVLTYADGSRGEIEMALSGTMSPDAGNGTVRMKARFYEGRRETGACDSGDVSWMAASGPMARLAAFVPDLRPLRGVPPAASSLAGPLSPERRIFAEAADSTCAREFNDMQGRDHEAVRRYTGRPNADRLVWETFVNGHEGEVRALRALQDPPEARALYTAWLENMASRARLERRMVRETYSHALATYARVVRMKAEANVLARRFGLTVCSSNPLPWAPGGPVSPPADLAGASPIDRGRRR